MNWEKFQEWLNTDFIKIQNLHISAADLLMALILPFLVFWISKFIRSLVRSGLKRVTHLDEGNRNAISTLAYYFCIGIGLTSVLSSLGIDSTSLAVFTGALGLGIGLGFQDIAKNFISGIIMLLSKTVKPGDIISSDDMLGRVEDVGMYSSRMKTAMDATVIIPNSEILNQKFVNWTHDRALRMIEIPIGVHYDSDLEVVQEILYDAATKVENILLDPPARVLLLTYGSSSVDFVTRVWTSEVMYFPRIVSAYNLEVWRQFKEKGVVIPYPQQDLHIYRWPKDENSRPGQ